MRRTGTRLDPILESVETRAAARRARQSVADLRREATADPARGARFVEALTSRNDFGGLSLLAECKRRSPSAGEISGELDLLGRADAYARGGAAAISVLTEQDHFGGGLADLERVAPAGLPRLRKDFILDEGMVLESLAAGADAILLLVVCLPDARLAELRQLAGELGLATLVEAHDAAELERALAVTPDLIGINARDLRTFEVDLGIVERLLPTIPDGVVRVAESGVHGPAELRRVRAAGAHAALVGEALMRQGDPEATLRIWSEELDR